MPRNNINHTKIVFNLIVMSIWFCLCQLSFASEEIINGSAKLNDKTFEALKVNGSLKFSNLIIKETLRINGSVSGEKLKCKEFFINGSFDGENIEAQNGTINGSFKGSRIVISEKVKISGGFSVANGDFGNIEINGRKSDLTNSKAKNILVKKPEFGVQELELKKTVISGDVTFESGEGKIYLSKDSKIQGTIKGTTVITK